MNPIKKSIKRKAAAKKIIHRRMLYAAGLGLIPIPIVDAAGILSTQVLMVKDIGHIYRIPFKGHVVKSLIGALVGSLGTSSVIKAIPGLGTIVGGAAMSLTGVAATYAIGKIFTLHFEQGGTLLDFDPVKSRKYFEQAYREGAIRAAALKDANKGRLENLFQIKTNNPTFKVSKDKINGKQTTVSLADQVAYQEMLKKVKRRKALKAKKRRKSRLKKIIGQLLLYIVLIVGAFGVYSKYIAPRFNLDKDALRSNEIDLFMKENEAKQVRLEAVPNLDSLTQVEIANFSSVSSEGVISKYLQNTNATYPKRYSLNAVRFTGTSEKISSGAEKQLANIALLMKKYPDLLVNLYGHTGNKGPVFNRQRIGRDRARVLTEVFTEHGIQSYRITGNYIEKQEGTSDGYWGAEIVLYVATIESVVDVAPPTMKDDIMSSISKVIEVPKKEETPIVKDTVANDTSPEIPIAKPAPEEKEQEATEEEDNPSDLLEVDTQQEQTIIDTNTVIKEPVPITPPEEPQKDSDKELIIAPPTPTPTPIAPPKPAPKKTTVEGVMQQYIESPNPKYPKIFPLNAISFNGESSDVNSRGRAQLVKIAALMQKHPKMQITINGQGAGKATVDTQEEKNRFLTKWQGIGQKRAKAIKKILHDQDIANKRIKTGYRLQNLGEDNTVWGADLVIEQN